MLASRTLFYRNSNGLLSQGRQDFTHAFADHNAATGEPVDYATELSRAIIVTYSDVSLPIQSRPQMVTLLAISLPQSARVEKRVFSTH